MKKQVAIKELNEETQQRVKDKIKDLILRADQLKNDLDKIEDYIKRLESGDLSLLDNSYEMKSPLYTGRYEKD